MGLSKGCVGKLLKSEMSNMLQQILLMPIDCISCSNEQIIIKKESGMIKSTQTYYSKLDPDMSDLAIGFYKIIYPEIGSILTNNGVLKNCNFAGDTMNSFNSIANITKGAGRSIKERKNISQSDWPPYLRNYFHSYHCLANFWLLPVCIGRKSKKLNYYDSMDVFLSVLQDEGFKLVFEKHRDYFSWVNDLNDFYKKHFLDAYSVNSKIPYVEDNSEKLVEQAISRIKDRAIDIANSEYANDLYNYFKSLELV